MRIDIVVVASTLRELEWLFQFHSKLFNVRSRMKFKLILADGAEVYYLTPKRFESWCLGKTYIHLQNYIMGDDCFYHGESRITKTELSDLMRKKGEPD